MANRFAAQGNRIFIPVLALPTFQNLSVEAALKRVVETIEEAARVAASVVVIGSSFGGFLALCSLQRLTVPAAQRLVGLVLLAPVIYPFHPEQPVVSSATEDAWRRLGVIPIEEGASGAAVPVHYQFLVELKRYAEEKPRVGVSTLVVHGVRDETVPHRHSVEFVDQTPMAQLVSLDDDHQIMRDPRRLVSVVDEFIRECAPGEFE
jgi:alpha-beta hydrolase superfamily lysophospholipase